MAAGIGIVIDAIVKYAWPFIKASYFKDESVLSIFRRNKIAVTAILAVVCALFYGVESIKLRLLVSALKKENIELRAKPVLPDTTSKTLNAVIVQVHLMDLQIKALTEDVKQLKERTPTSTTPTVVKPPRPTHKPVKGSTKPKSTIRDKLRSLERVGDLE